jgi:hypothetical protein
MARLQAWQVPLHALVQQVPSTHSPRAHWFPEVQAAPGPRCGEQVPDSQ